MCAAVGDHHGGQAVSPGIGAGISTALASVEPGRHHCGLADLPHPGEL